MKMSFSSLYLSGRVPDITAPSAAVPADHPDRAHLRNRRPGVTVDAVPQKPDSLPGHILKAAVDGAQRDREGKEPAQVVEANDAEIVPPDGPGPLHGGQGIPCLHVAE